MIGGRTVARLLGCAIVAVEIASTLAGCASSSPRAYRGTLPAIDTLHVAMLPILNLTGEAEASRVVMDDLLVELLKRTDLALIAPAEVEAALTELRIRDPGAMTLTESRGLGEKLGAGLFILGTVTDYRLETDAARPLPVVSLNMRAVDPSSGTIVWAATHACTGSDGESVFGIGRVTSLPRLAARAVQEVLATFPRGRTS